MLRVIGVESPDGLFSDIPESIRLKGTLDLPRAISEMELSMHMDEIGFRNKSFVPFIGGGAYRHYIPAVVDQLSSRSEFYTSYTPYQAEVSQGTLVAIFEYQTMIARLTGMDISNASMYDGATALAESVFMSMRANGKKKVLVSAAVHPHYREVLKTYLWASDGIYHEVPYTRGVTDIDALRENIDGDVGSVVVQNPNFFGSIEDIAAMATLMHERGTHCIVCVTEPVSLGILKSPGSLGADIVCGEGQAFGNPTGFGGPLLGFLGARNEFMRRMPGRLVGKTVDAQGTEAYVLTLQAREQHIRRDRATSNICTNQGLCALRAVIYLALLGPRLRDLARLNHELASYLRNGLIGIGFQPLFSAPYFNEFTVRHERAEDIHAAMKVKGYYSGIMMEQYYPELKGGLLICATEMNTKEQMDAMLTGIKEVL